eukprot:762384-Amphidinium_carterae.1
MARYLRKLHQSHSSLCIHENMGESLKLRCRIPNYTQLACACLIVARADANQGWLPTTSLDGVDRLILHSTSRAAILPASFLLEYRESGTCPVVNTCLCQVHAFGTRNQSGTKPVQTLFAIEKTRRRKQ